MGRRRLLLLGGQATALGAATALLVVPAGALILTTYGVESLPYVYLTVAVALGLARPLVERTRRNAAPLGPGRGLLLVTTFLLAAGWLVLATSTATWVAFPLLVLGWVGAPVSTELIAAQARWLVSPEDRARHLRHARSAHGAGFFGGGMAAGLLVGPLGGPRHLVAGALLACLAALVLFIRAARTGPVAGRRSARGRGRTARALRRLDRPEEQGAPTVPVAELLAQPLVRRLLAYQALAVVVLWLLDFLVWSHAVVAYPDPTGLTRFLGFFGAGTQVVGALFVLLFAGLLLRRTGIGVGLGGGPLLVLWVLVATTLTGFVMGSGALLFLTLACTQRLVGIVWTDGAGRPSVESAAQALAPEEREQTRDLADRVGVPVALGSVGLLLAAVDAVGYGARTVAVVTLVLTVAWAMSATLTHRQYGRDLRGAIVRRGWDPDALRIDDDASRMAVLHLLTSPDAEDVRAALDALVDAGHDVSDHLVVFLADPDPARRRVAIETAASADRMGVRRVADAVAERLSDVHVEVATTAAAAVVGLDRRRRWRGRATWVSAVSADDQERVRIALRAAAACPHPFFVPHLVAVASTTPTTSHVLEALGAHRDHLAAAVEGLLEDRDVPRATRERVVHFLGSAGTPEARDLLLRRLDDRDTSVAHAAALCLAALGARVTPEEAQLGRRLLAVAERTHRCLQILLLLDDAPARDPLRQALRDDVAASAHHAEALLDLVHDPRAIGPAVARLASPQEHDGALAALGATVGPSWARLALALVDPLLDDTSRRDLLATYAPVAAHDLPDWLRDLVLDEDDYWHEPWLRACALYAERDLSPADAISLAERLLDDPDPDVAQTARQVAGSPGREAAGLGQ